MKNEDTIGTEEWFVKHDPHIALKERNEGMVWAVWGVGLILLAILLAIGVYAVFNTKPTVEPHLRECFASPERSLNADSLHP